MIKKIISFAVLTLFVIGNLYASESYDTPHNSRVIKIDPGTLRVIDVKYNNKHAKKKAVKPIAQPIFRNLETIHDCMTYLNSIGKVGFRKPGAISIKEIISAHFPEKAFAKELGDIGEQVNRQIMNMLFKEMGAYVVEFRTHNASNHGHDRCCAIYVNGEWALLIEEDKFKSHHKSVCKIFEETYYAENIERRNKIADTDFQESFEAFIADPKKSIYNLVYALKDDGRSEYLTRKLDKKCFRIDLEVAKLRKFRALSGDDPFNKDVSTQAVHVAELATAFFKTPERKRATRWILGATQDELADHVLSTPENKRKVGQKSKTEGPEDGRNRKRTKQELIDDLSEFSPASRKEIMSIAEKRSKSIGAAKPQQSMFAYAWQRLSLFS